MPLWFHEIFVCFNLFFFIFVLAQRSFGKWAEEDASQKTPRLGSAESTWDSKEATQKSWNSSRSYREVWLNLREGKIALQSRLTPSWNLLWQKIQLKNRTSGIGHHCCESRKGTRAMGKASRMRHSIKEHWSHSPPQLKHHHQKNHRTNHWLGPFFRQPIKKIESQNHPNQGRR